MLPPSYKLACAITLTPALVEVHSWIDEFRANQSASILAFCLFFGIAILVSSFIVSALRQVLHEGDKNGN